jgi:hypothetical protein
MQRPPTGPEGRRLSGGRRRARHWAKATASGGRMPPSSRRALSGRALVPARSSPRRQGSGRARRLESRECSSERRRPGNVKAAVAGCDAGRPRWPIRRRPSGCPYAPPRTTSSASIWWPRLSETGCAIAGASAAALVLATSRTLAWLAPDSMGSAVKRSRSPCSGFRAEQDRDDGQREARPHAKACLLPGAVVPGPLAPSTRGGRGLGRGAMIASTPERQPGQQGALPDGGASES